MPTNRTDVRSSLGDDGGNPFRFTGREDDGTGLLFYRTRYQDPGPDGSSARTSSTRTAADWLSRIDPTALLGGAAEAPTQTTLALPTVARQVGGYRYVDSSPMAGRDPRGTCPVCIVVVGAIVIGTMPVWVPWMHQPVKLKSEPQHWWESSGDGAEELANSRACEGVDPNVNETKFICSP